jgi:hypothetical protein
MFINFMSHAFNLSYATFQSTHSQEVLSLTSSTTLNTQRSPGIYQIVITIKFEHTYLLHMHNKLQAD